MQGRVSGRPLRIIAEWLSVLLLPVSAVLLNVLVHAARSEIGTTCSPVPPPAQIEYMVDGWTMGPVTYLTLCGSALIMLLRGIVSCHKLCSAFVPKRLSF